MKHYELCCLYLYPVSSTPDSDASDSLIFILLRRIRIAYYNVVLVPWSILNLRGTHMCIGNDSTRG